MYVFLYNTIKWPYQPKHSPSYPRSRKGVSKGNTFGSVCLSVRTLNSKTIACSGFFIAMVLSLLCDVDVCIYSGLFFAMDLFL